MLHGYTYTVFNVIERHGSVLNFSRRHLETTNVDDIITAACEVYKALFVLVPHICHLYLSFVQHVCSSFFITYISTHDGFAGNHKTAIFTYLKISIMHRTSYTPFHILAIVELIGRYTADFCSSIGVVKP